MSPNKAMSLERDIHTFLLNIVVNYVYHLCQPIASSSHRYSLDIYSSLSYSD